MVLKIISQGIEGKDIWRMPAIRTARNAAAHEYWGRERGRERGRGRERDEKFDKVLVSSSNWLTVRNWV